MKNNDSRMIAIADAMNRANNKHKGIRWAKRIHDVILTTFAVLVAITGAVYAYEEFRPINEDIVIPALVSVLGEIEATDPIELWPLVYINPELKDAKLATSLWCDYGTGAGYEFTSSSIQPISSTLTMDQVDIVQQNLTANQTANTNSISRWLRTYAGSQDFEKFVYNGSIPTAVATCYGEHTVTAKTPILGIDKTLTTPSYSFEYVWYSQPGYDENDD